MWNASITRPSPGWPALRQASRYADSSDASFAPASGIAMIEWPFAPALMKDASVASAATQNGGRGCWVGRGSEVVAGKRWNRPSNATSSSRSKPVDDRDALVESVTTLVEAHAEPLELVRQERACESDLESTARDRVEHADLTRELERVVEHGEHRAGDEPHRRRASRRGGEEDSGLGEYPP